MLSGPPESMREHVVAASKAMMIGDWKKCRDYIMAVKVCKVLKSSPPELHVYKQNFFWDGKPDALWSSLGTNIFVPHGFFFDNYLSVSGLEAI